MAKKTLIRFDCVLKAFTLCRAMQSHAKTRRIEVKAKTMKKIKIINIVLDGEKMRWGRKSWLSAWWGSTLKALKNFPKKNKYTKVCERACVWAFGYDDVNYDIYNVCATCSGKSAHVCACVCGCTLLFFHTIYSFHTVVISYNSLFLITSFCLSATHKMLSKYFLIPVVCLLFCCWKIITHE